ncbi:DHA2 family multidrug resistance protein-like MFS transporter [Acinetobacter calcoaceticus]|uniref:DHA2 family multidrug resistance protein-like MFS transporter n=1 Tax=Acinetobacter calcoaceticus TaxID=471 RepID=A0A4R1XSK2_ACICA|nr:DHA2 family multidrug resistance protein-like MFS transporter [Acinetobacter calcoaceticus]
MQRQWVILLIIILVYLPVSIDATVLHVAIPSLNSALSLSNNQMLWIIDIYSLVMAGLLLPMGALGDRIGFKRLMMLGASIFGIASLCAAFSNSAAQLIGARVLLALGAAMIIPATLAGLRHTFEDEKQRNFALGIWGTVGGGGAAIGPLVGGFILEHFHWGMVFLINVPIILVVLVMIYFVVPKQKSDPKQALNLMQALTLVTAILLIIYAIKTLLYGFNLPSLGCLIIGALLLLAFIRHQLSTDRAMIDFRLFQKPVIAISMVMIIVAMLALVGFELLLAQELQFVYGYSPLQAGLFILPFIIAISVGGPLASLLVNRYGLRSVSTAGLLFSAISFWGLAQLNFKTDHYQAWAWMIVLGINVEIVLLSATAAMMSSVPAEKATAAGAIEGMAYELGAGLGVAIFGLLLSFFYMQNIMYPAGLTPTEITALGHSLGETLQAVPHLDPQLAAQVTQSAFTAFSHSHSKVMYSAAGLFLLLAIFIWRRMPVQASANVECQDQT